MSAGLLMSDALVAALTLIMTFCFSTTSRRQLVMLGALVGSLVAVRFVNLVNVVAFLAVVAARSRRRALIGASLGLVGLLGIVVTNFERIIGYYVLFDEAFHWSFALLLHWTEDQQPYTTDGPWVVGDALQGALMQWVCPCPAGGPLSAFPNVLFYPAVLLGAFWVFGPPFATLPGLVYLWRRRETQVAGFALWSIGLTLALYTIYFYQAVRYMAPAATVLLIFSAIAIARAADRWRWPAWSSAAALPWSSRLLMGIEAIVRKVRSEAGSDVSAGR
jgi:hypothetical protein